MQKHEMHVLGSLTIKAFTKIRSLQLLHQSFAEPEQEDPLLFFPTPRKEKTNRNSTHLTFHAFFGKYSGCFQTVSDRSWVWH